MGLNVSTRNDLSLIKPLFPSQDPSFPTPPEWDDQERIDILFGPLTKPDPNQNLAAYQRWKNNILFWTQLIINVTSFHEYFFNKPPVISAGLLQLLFTRDGSVPMGINMVLEQMLLNGEIEILKIYEKSIAWGFWNRIWRLVPQRFLVDGNCVYIVVSTLKKTSYRVEKWVQNECKKDKIFFLSDLENLVKVDNLELLCPFFQNAIIFEAQGRKAIKFVFDKQNQKVTKNDEYALYLQSVIDDLEESIETFEEEKKRCESKAVEQKKKNNIQGALHQMRIRARIMENIKHNQDSVFNLYNIKLEVIKSMTNSDIAELLKSAADIISEINKKVDLDKVEKVTDQLANLHIESEEMSKLLSETLLTEDTNIVNDDIFQKIEKQTDVSALQLEQVKLDMMELQKMESELGFQKEQKIQVFDSKTLNTEKF